MKPVQKLWKSNKNLFHSFCELSYAINSSLKPDIILEHLLDIALEMMGAERGFVLFFEKESGKFTVKVARNIYPADIEKEESQISHTVIETVKNSHELMFTNNAPADRRLTETTTISREGIQSILCGPIQADNEIYGIIYIDDKRNIQDLFGNEDLEGLKAICNLAAIAIKNATLYNELKSFYKDTVTSLVNAIMKKDPYTKGHSERVTEYALLIGKEINLDEKKLEELEYAAILHDVGKIGIKEEILLKPTKLTDEEWDEIKKHPPFGYEIMAPLSLSEEVKLAILHHQERYDGSGYPGRLKGDNIPILARIIAVADTYDAMTSSRVYRTAFSKEEAMQKLEKCKGIQLDPIIVEAFFRTKITKST